MVPRMADSSKILYTIYLALTVIQILFYLAGGMPVFDALCNTFGTAGTGGLAIKRDSFLSYSYYAQTVTTVFMALFGVNFSIYFFLLRRKFDLVWKNTELRWYLGLIFGAIAVITVNTLSYYPRVYDAFHHAFFTVSSIMTTTGFCTANFDTWPELSRVILVFLMFIGSCAGSTAGGLKVSRLVILVKHALCELRRCAAVILLIEEEPGFLSMDIIHVVQDAVFPDRHVSVQIRPKTVERHKACPLLHAFFLPEFDIVALVDRVDLRTVCVQRLQQERE